MKWRWGFALHLRLLRQSVLLLQSVEPTPLLGKILDPTLPSDNRNHNQANNRSGERKRGNVGLQFKTRCLMIFATPRVADATVSGQRQEKPVKETPAW
jgi:hypothetical protein